MLSLKKYKSNAGLSAWFLLQRTFVAEIKPLIGVHSITMISGSEIVAKILVSPKKKVKLSRAVVWYDSFNLGYLLVGNETLYKNPFFLFYILYNGLTILAF